MTYVYLDIKNIKTDNHVDLDIEIYVNEVALIHKKYCGNELNPLLGEIELTNKIKEIKVQGSISVNGKDLNILLNIDRLNDISEFTYPLYNESLTINEKILGLIDGLKNLEDEIDDSDIYKCSMFYDNITEVKLTHLRSRLLEKENEFNIVFPPILEKLLPIDFYYDDHVETLYKNDLKELKSVKDTFIYLWGEAEHNKSEKSLNSDIKKKYERSIAFFSGCGDGCYGLAWDPLKYDSDDINDTIGGENSGRWFWFAEEYFYEPLELLNIDKTPISDISAIYSIFYRFILGESFQITDTVRNNIDTNTQTVLDIHITENWNGLSLTTR